jgi:hypothetical protein
MTHGERKMAMPTWPVRFDGVPTEVKSAPLLGEHTAEVLADWLGLDAAAIAILRQDGIVRRGRLLKVPASTEWAFSIGRTRSMVGPLRA